MKITVKTEINSNIETIWKSFTNVNEIMKWNFANDSWHCPFVYNDFKVSGNFVYKMSAKDNSFSFDFTGMYIEIIKYEKIIYRIDDGRMVYVLFEKNIENDNVVVTEIFDAEDINSIEIQKDGWQSILNNFKKYVEGISVL